LEFAWTGPGLHGWHMPPESDEELERQGFMSETEVAIAAPELPALPATGTHVEAAALSLLPRDLQTQVQRACCDVGATRLSSTCRLWHAVYAADRSRARRRAIIRILTDWTGGQNVLDLGSSVPADGSGWEACWERLHELLVRLASMKSPGCRFQKYLRWLDGAAPSSPQVVRGILGVSLLPTTLVETVCDVEPDPTGPPGVARPATRWASTVESAIRFACSCHGSSKYIRGPCSLACVDLPRFLRVLEWVTAEQRRLRLLMAELHQIACRGTSRFLAGPRFTKAEAAELAKLAWLPSDRQTESFTHLIRIAAAAVGEHQGGDGAGGADVDCDHGGGKGLRFWA